uniref:Uncharacterized protein n=1 Tax=Glossina pallidipes TaxID=7398 RepID=A0A1B0A406_GLOPL
MRMDVHLIHWSLLFITLSCFLFYAFASEKAKYVNQAASAINNEAADALVAVVKDVNEIVAGVLESEVSSEEASNQETMPNLEKINKLSQSSILMREPSITSPPLMELEDPQRPVKVSVDVLHSDSASGKNIKKLQTNNKNDDSIDNVDNLRTTDIEHQSNALEANDNADKASEGDKDDRRHCPPEQAILPKNLPQKSSNYPYSKSLSDFIQLLISVVLAAFNLSPILRYCYNFPNVKSFPKFKMLTQASIHNKVQPSLV